MRRSKFGEERMSKSNINIQDGFLFQNLKKHDPVRVELMTGKVLEGPLVRFDRFALVVMQDDEEVLIYKHAIATIAAA